MYETHAGSPRRLRAGRGHPALRRAGSRPARCGGRPLPRDRAAPPRSSWSRPPASSPRIPSRSVTWRPSATSPRSSADCRRKASAFARASPSAAPGGGDPRGRPGHQRRPHRHGDARPVRSRPGAVRIGGRVGASILARARAPDPDDTPRATRRPSLGPGSDGAREAGAARPALRTQSDARRSGMRVSELDESGRRHARGHRRPATRPSTGCAAGRCVTCRCWTGTARSSASSPTATSATACSRPTRYRQIGKIAVSVLLRQAPVRAVMSAPVRCIGSRPTSRKRPSGCGGTRWDAFPLSMARRLVGMLTEIDVLRSIVAAEALESPELDVVISYP